MKDNLIRQIGRRGRSRAITIAGAVILMVCSPGFFTIDTAAQAEMLPEEQAILLIEDEAGGQDAPGEYAQDTSGGQSLPGGYEQDVYDGGWEEEADVTLSDDELLDLFSDIETVIPQEGDAQDTAPTLSSVLESEKQQEEERREQLEAMLRMEQGGRPLLTAAQTDSLASWLDMLLQTESPTGSDGELIVGRSIEAAMEEMGYTISEQNFHEGFLNEDGVDLPGLNIIAERGADSEERTGDILILCAHYDSKHVPKNGDPLTEEDRHLEKDPLAEDKTGAAVLLELARIFSSELTDIDLCFLFLSGETDGWYGSANFAGFLENNGLSRVKGVLSIERAGYCRVRNGNAEPLTCLLLTANGDETRIGHLVQSEGMLIEAEALMEADREAAEEAEALQEAAEAGLDVSAGAGSAAALEELLLREDWNYRKDTGSSAAALAALGLDAAAFTQEVPGQTGSPEMPENMVNGTPGSPESMEDMVNGMPGTQENMANGTSGNPEDMVNGTPGNPEDMEMPADMGMSENVTLEDSGDIYIDLDQLAQTTDILAAAMGRMIVSGQGQYYSQE